MLVVALISAAILIPLALIVPWFPAEGSSQAGDIHTLYDVLLIASVPIFVLVLTVVGFSIWRFRMRPGQDKADGGHDGTFVATSYSLVESWPQAGSLWAGGPGPMGLASTSATGRLDHKLATAASGRPLHA